MQIKWVLQVIVLDIFIVASLLICGVFLSIPFLLLLLLRCWRRDRYSTMWHKHAKFLLIICVIYLHHGILIRNGLFERYQTFMTISDSTFGNEWKNVQVCLLGVDKQAHIWWCEKNSGSVVKHTVRHTNIHSLTTKLITYTSHVLVDFLCYTQGSPI